MSLPIGAYVVGVLIGMWLGWRLCRLHDALKRAEDPTASFRHGIRR